MQKLILKINSVYKNISVPNNNLAQKVKEVVDDKAQYTD
jgi:hypothetical protein